MSLSLSAGRKSFFKAVCIPTLKLEWYEDLVRHIHEKYPIISRFTGLARLRLIISLKFQRLVLMEVLQTLEKSGFKFDSGVLAKRRF